ncbi:MAG: MBL fold metallo-hydrolase [Bacteroidetes bacterium]|nr:MBL fold metallo-hydrolase [Bacteroidota bacterium]
MINIQQFTFNSFMVNSYLLWDETLEAIVIDAACYDTNEQEQFSETVGKRHLKLTRNLNTHCHIDHVLGNEFIASTFGINPEYHQNSVLFLNTMKEMGSSFGFKINKIPPSRRFLEDDETIAWGNSSLKVLYTPGHADGSVCFYNAADGFVITGDVLFKDTIGRTDLPTGDFDQLMNSIKTKLFSLPDSTVVYPGHGPETNIGYEKVNNPFIR